MTGVESRERYGLAVAAVAMVVWWSRAPFAAASLWAEDGTNWLQDAVEVGWIEAFGRADAGYFHFLPRVAGAVASWFPLEAGALVMWTMSALAVGWFTFTTFTASHTWLASPIARAILALAIVALPVHRDESIGNVANLHFVMMFVGLIVLISVPTKSWERRNGIVALIALALSTPLALALAPFAAWRLLRTRRLAFDGLAVAWAVGVVGQFVPVLLVQPERPSTEGSSLVGAGGRLVTEVAALNFFPTERGDLVVGSMLLLAVATLVVLGAVSAWRSEARERATLLLAVPAIGGLVHAVSSLGFGARPRYALFPALCLLWAALVATETLLERAARVKDRTVFALVGLGLAVAWLPHWTATDYRRSSPDWAEGLEAAERRCLATDAATVEVVIGPTDLPPDRSWSVRLACSDLTDSDPAR